MKGICSFLALSLFSLGACTSSDGGSIEPDDGFDRRALVASLGEHVVVPSYEHFNRDAAALSAAVSTFATASAAGDATAERAAARNAFREAFIQWQRLEVLQIGPAGSPATFDGGEGLRDTVYSWPTANACRVDQIVYSEDYAASDFFQRELVNAYGFDVLEYLLFAPGPDNACALSVPLNRDGLWNQLSVEQIDTRRAEYAARVAAHIAEQAGELHDRWRPGRGDFLANLQRAGESGSVYGSAQRAVDQLFASMFYVEREVKDLKLAAPLGISGACTSSATCPELVEAPHADLALEAAHANLEAFEALFVGAWPGDETQRVGFDDFLAGLGAEALRDQMLSDIAQAREALEGFEVPMSQALTGSTSEVVSAYEELKDVTDVLKSQFVSVLSLRVPDEGAGDND